MWNRLLLISLILIPSTALAVDYSADFELASSQYFSITDASQSGLDITGDHTFEMWVKLESAPGSGSQYTLYSKYGSNQRSYKLEYFNSGGTYGLNFVTSSNGTAGAEGANTHIVTLPTGTWTHLAVAYDLSAGSAEFFIDGVSSGTEAGGNTTIHSGSGDFQMGANILESGRYFDGLLADVRAWSDLRTESEIDTNKDNCSLSTSEPGLISWWKLNGNADDSSATNDLTNNNSVVFSTDQPYVCSDPPAEEGEVATTTTEILYKDWIFVNSVIIFFLSFIGWGLLFSPVKERIKQW